MHTWASGWAAQSASKLAAGFDLGVCLVYRPQGIRAGGRSGCKSKHENGELE